MTSDTDSDKPDDQGGHAGHGLWLMVACCVPMIIIVALIALKVL